MVRSAERRGTSRTHGAFMTLVWSSSRQGLDERDDARSVSP